MTESKLLALLRQWEAEREVAATCNEWRNLSHRELTAVVECAMLNDQVPSADGSGEVPYLEFAIQAEIVKAWETHSLKASVFRDICLSSKQPGTFARRSCCRVLEHLSTSSGESYSITGSGPFGRTFRNGSRLNNSRSLFPGIAQWSRRKRMRTGLI